MRLINTRTGAFEEFIGNKIPSYAILSHTWEEEEVSFKDMSDPSCKSKKGYEKIDMTCRVAAMEGIGYAWVDTCCIDKSSSAELTEAINSMFQWYKASTVCYAYLSDLPASGELDEDLPKCRWFTRGWTLQELIAPSNVRFFDQDWHVRGTKSALAAELSNATGIRVAALHSTLTVQTICVAQKFSWAARRQTTRVEDAAYCLLGLFDVNMPLLYGEGEKAFQRLQEEILKSTADLSIFSWTIPFPTTATVPSEDQTFCGVLAKHPSAFASCKSVDQERDAAPQEVSISNIGVKTRIQLRCEWDDDEQKHQYILPLACYESIRRGHGYYGRYFGIKLRKCGPNQFVRVEPWILLSSDYAAYPDALSDVYLQTKFPPSNIANHYVRDTRELIGRTRTYALQIRLPSHMAMYDEWPASRFDKEDHLFFVSGDYKWGSCSFKITASPVVLIDNQPTKLRVECMFYGLGWSSKSNHGTDGLQCTIVDYNAMSTQLDYLQSSLASSDDPRALIVQRLNSSRIPKSSSATIAIPGSTQLVTVSFKSSLARDPQMCANQFWKIGFSCTVHDNYNYAPVTPQEWITE